MLTLPWRRHDRELRKRLRQDLAAAGIDGPMTMENVCKRLGQHRGREIRLLPWQLPAEGPFGLWLAGDHADYIVVQSRTSPAHKEHIIAHELGHLLAGHTSDEADQDAEQLQSELIPGIPPDMVRRALRRTHYDSPQEREAETVATILREAAAASVTQPGGTARARATQDALGDHQGWRL